MLRISRLAVAGLVLGLGSASQAALVKFVIPMTGAQEVPGPGDSDGTGTAFITIDNATSPNPTISWNFVVSNIALPISAAHIHTGAAGASGSPVVDFSGQLSGSGLQDVDLRNVLNNPAGFYVNVHNSAFPAGAIRGQMNAPVPATGTYALVALAVLLLGAAVMVFKSRQPVLA